MSNPKTNKDKYGVRCTIGVRVKFKVEVRVRVRAKARVSFRVRIRFRVEEELGLGSWTLMSKERRDRALIEFRILRTSKHKTGVRLGLWLGLGLRLG